MGFYDYRCQATGLSLRAEKAVCVLVLEEPKGTWVPASLPMKGTYNRLGTIDGVQHDFHTKLIAENFQASLESKRIKLAGEAAYAWKKPGRDWHDKPFEGIDRVLTTIERATSLGPTEVQLSGRSLNHVLIHAGFYEAATRELSSPEPEVNTSELLALAFPSEPSRWFLRELPELTSLRAEARAALHAFLNFRRFLEPKVKWHSKPDLGQHGVLETIDGFATARARFSDVPWAKRVLDELESSAEKSERDYDAGWLRHSTKSWIGVAQTGGVRTVLTSHEAVHELLERWVRDELASGEEKFQLIVVQEGIPQPALDLLPLIRLQGNARTVRLSESTLDDRRDSNEPRLVYQWDEIAQLLPQLSGALLPRGAPAYVRVSGGTPSWAEPEEKYLPLIHFGEAS
jgi:hypothetical protein